MSLPMHGQGRDGGRHAGTGGIRCPLCGQPTGHTAGACSVCPVGRWGCGTLTCTYCGYRFVAEGKWLARLERFKTFMARCFGTSRSRRVSDALGVAGVTNPVGVEERPDGLVGGLKGALEFRRAPTLAELLAGEAARVEAMGSEHAARLARLSAYGVVPGSHLRVIQTRPAILVEVEGTRLALEAGVAAGIQVRRLGS